MATNDQTPGSMRRRPLIAAILSGLFPGLGQWYNRERLKALAFLVAAVVTSVGPLSPLDVDIDVDNPAAGLRHVLLAGLPFLAIAVWSVVDAYRVAGRRHA
jgi:hypothetical protein